MNDGVKVFQGHVRSGHYRSAVGLPIAIRWRGCSLVEEALMLKHKALRLQIAGAATVAMLFGTSAFAESRHHNGTRGGGSSSSHSSSRGGGGSSSHSFFGRGGGSSAPRFESRSFGSRSSGSRSFGSRSSGSRSFGSRGSAPRSVSPSWRGGRSSGGRSFGGRSGGSFRGFNSGSRFFGRGRIDRIVPFNGGYRLWLGGW